QSTVVKVARARKNKRPAIQASILSNLLSIFKGAVFGLKSDFFAFSFLNPSDNLGVYPMKFCNIDDFFGIFFLQIYLHPVAHIEYFVHLLPVGAAFFLNNSEQRWCFKKVVLDHVEVINEMQHLGLCATAAMHQSMNVWPEVLQHFHHDRCISACR